MQEKRIDDYWNVDSNRSLSDSWKGFTKFTPLTKKSPSDFCGLGGDWQKFKRLRDQIMYVWPEVWSKIGKAAQNREQQEWKREKPKLDNTRRLRGIYFIDPGDEETRKPFKIRGESWNCLMPCKKEIILVPGNWLRRWLHLTRFQRPSMVVLWNPTNPQGNEWNLLVLKNTKITLQVKGLLDDPLQFGSQVYS